MNFNAMDYDLVPGLPHFNDNQIGAQDQSLANTTPQGNEPAIDPDNDTRTAYDYKSDYQQALRDTTDSTDTDGYYVSKNGNKYEMVDNTRKGELGTGIASYMASFFASRGDWQKAYISSFNSVNDLVEKAKRYARIDEYEAKGYNTMDIQNYIKDGDPKTLIASKGKWKSDNGFMVNELTGEMKQLPQTAAQQETERHNRATESNDAIKAQADKSGSWQKLDNGIMFNTKTGETSAAPTANGEANAPLGYLDDEHRFALVPNSSGGPVTSTKSGEVMVRDLQTGKTGFRMGTTQSSDAAAQSAQGFVDMTNPDDKDSVVNKIDFSLFGGDRWSKVKRFGEGEISSAVSNNQNQIDTLNGAIKGMIEDKLTVENRGQRPSVQQIKAAVEKVGFIDMNTDEKTAKATLERARKFGSSTLTTADQNRKGSDEGTERHALKAQADYEGSPSTKPDGSTASISGLSYKVVNGHWRVQQ